MIHVSRHWKQTTQETLRRLKLYEPLVLIAGLIIVAGTWGFIELADEVLEGDTQWLDEWVVHAMRRKNNPALPIGPLWLLEIARNITALGSHVVLLLATSAVAGFLLLERKYRSMWLVIGATATGALLSTALKLFFSRERPDLPPLAYTFTASFPSGHAMLSAVVYLTLGSMLARAYPKRAIRMYFIGIFMFTTFLIGLSRVYLGLHYPTDILAGWTAGLVWALLCWLGSWYLKPR
jgi:undecaprenyl-diphosphatase